MSRRRLPRASKLCSYEVLNTLLFNTKAADSLRMMRIRGRYLIGSQNENVVVSPGMRNMILKFARGSAIQDRGTYNSGAAKKLFVIGAEIDPPADPGTIDGGIAAGASTATITTGSVVPGWYFLQDKNRKETHANNGIVKIVGGELVYVSTVVGSTATFRTPTTQAYASAASGGNTVLSTPGSTVCENVGIRGGKFVGVKTDDVDASYAACVAAYWVAGLTVQGATAVKSVSSAFTNLYCRDLDYYRCFGAELPVGQTGLSYTFQFDRCVAINVRSCVAANARYGFVVERGSSKFTMTDIVGYSCAAAVFDVHGGDAYDGTVTRAIANGQSIRLGNTSWRRGCSNVTLNQCIADDFTLIGAVRNSTWDGASIGSVKLANTSDDPNVNAPPGYQSVITVKNCTITNPSSKSRIAIELTGDNSPTTFRFVTIRFDNCSIYQLNTGTVLLRAATVRALSDLVFVGCYMQIDGTNDMMRPENDNNEVGGVTIQWVGCNAQLSATKKVATCLLFGGATTTVSKFLNTTNGGTNPNKRRPSGGSYANLTSADVSIVGWVPS